MDYQPIQPCICKFYQSIPLLNQEYDYYILLVELLGYMVSFHATYSYIIFNELIN